MSLPRGDVLAVALLAAGGLAYEISLTRLLSALLVSSWVAPVLAVALLGVGLGAAIAAAWPAARERPAARVAAGLAGVLGSLSVPAWLLSVAAEAPLAGLALPLLTYAATGLAGAAILSWHPPRAAVLLRADYGAAALAAIATPWLLTFLPVGAPGLLLIAAGLIALAVFALGTARERRNPTGTFDLALAAGLLGVAAPLLVGLAIAVGSLGVVPELHMRAKPISLALARGGEVEVTRWDATARTDLVRTPDGARYLYMDGGAGSLVPTPDPRDWDRDIGAFAFAVRPGDSAFLIGTGGGLDVAQARAAGFTDVVAAEVNRASVELVRELGDAAADVYVEPVDVIVGDGRRVLAGTDERFDVITLANVVTGAAELRGAALTENLVYTVEAFMEYLAHLQPDGHLALKLYDELTLTRALTTAVTALVEGGYAEDDSAAMAHLLAVLDASASTAIPVLVVKRLPYTRDEAVAAARLAERNGWSLLLIPGLLAPPPLQPLADGMSDLADVIASASDVDVSPTRDAAPYFFSFEPGVPRDASRAGVAAAALLALLIVTALAAGRAGAGPTRRSAGRGLLTAVWLGLGFLVVELAALPVIQRAVGHPAWSLSATLGAVLVGGAVGAHLAARSARSGVRLPAAVAAMTLGAWLLAAPVLTAVLLGSVPALAGPVLSITLALAAIPMGMPFPRLLSHLHVPRSVAAALALSGVAAVVAGAGALWVSHAFGWQALAGSAVCVYVLAAICAPRRPHRHGDPSEPLPA